MSQDVASRAERKERTRRAILEAALDLSEDTGLASLSLRQVAREVGIVPTAFYRHFDSIEELGLALVQQCFASLGAMMRDVRHTDPALGTMIAGSVETLVGHVRERPTHYRFLVRERAGGIPVVREQILAQVRRFERELATDLARIPGPDRWSTEDRGTLANLIVLAMVATAEQVLDGEAGRDAEAAIVQRAEQQLRMIVVGAAQWQGERHEPRAEARPDALPAAGAVRGLSAR